MIKLSRKRTLADLPTDFQGQKLEVKHVELLGLYFDSMNAGKPIAFPSARWKSAKVKLRNDTARKCAYCEAPTSVVAHGDVEHFRPKSIYWWLAYCFDNYLFSCQICNQLFKGDSFPFSGSALSAPAVNGAAPNRCDWPEIVSSFMIDASAVTDQDCISKWGPEDADLPHPYLEDPEPLFRYAVDTASEEVWLRAADGERAQRALKAAEDVLGLNREELRKLRYVEFATIAVLKSVLEEPMLSAATRTHILNEFARRQRSDFPFAGMHRYFVRVWAIPLA